MRKMIAVLSFLFLASVPVLAKRKSRSVSLLNGEISTTGHYGCNVGRVEKLRGFGQKAEEARFDCNGWMEQFAGIQVKAGDSGRTAEGWVPDTAEKIISGLSPTRSMSVRGPVSVTNDGQSVYAGIYKAYFQSNGNQSDVAYVAVVEHTVGNHYYIAVFTVATLASDEESCSNGNSNCVNGQFVSPALDQLVNNMHFAR